MAARTKLVLAVAVIFVLGPGVINSQAGRRHSHRVTIKGFVRSTTLPPANDAATSGIESVSAVCPEGYRATGGGYKVETVALVPDAELFTNAYEIVAINETNTAATMSADVACVKGKTSATRAALDRGRSARLVARYRAQRER